MKQQSGNFKRQERKVEKISKAEKVYNALRKEKARAAARKAPVAASDV